jgi:hypothetical protein
MPGSLPQIVQSQAERLCEKALSAALSQTSQHDTDHGEVDPGFADCWLAVHNPWPVDERLEALRESTGPL